MTTFAENPTHDHRTLSLPEALPSLREAISEIADAWFALAAEGAASGIFEAMILPRREP